MRAYAQAAVRPTSAGRRADAAHRVSAPWAGWLRPERLRAIRHGLYLAGLLAVGYAVVFLVRSPTLGFDAYAYWLVDPADPYANWRNHIDPGIFRYSPAAATVAGVFGLVPWPVFLALWTALLIGTAVALGGRYALALFAFPPVVFDIVVGNIHLLMAAAIVLGFRWPGAWALILLTKVTPGVGLLWFLVRREWRPLLIALGTTALLVAVSYAAAPALWQEWISLLSAGNIGPTQSVVPVALPVRLAIAAAVVTWGARTDRMWTVPVAAMIALPVPWVAIGPAMLAAVVPLVKRDVVRPERTRRSHTERIRAA